MRTISEGRTPLHLAAKGSYLRVAHILVTGSCRGPKAGIDARAAKGTTALEIALQHKNDELAAMLIENGASLGTLGGGRTMAQVIAELPPRAAAAIRMPWGAR